MPSSAIASAVLDFLLANDHFFLNLSMAACKAALDAAHGVDGSTVVTAMARNGVEFGFLTYTKHAFGLMLISIAISTLYLWWRYL